MKAGLTKRLIGLILLGLVFFAPAAQAQVLDPVCEGVSDATVCQDNTEQDAGSNALYGPNGVLTKAAEIIATIVGIASVIVIIIGGFRYVLATGDPSKLGAARATIIYALVGLLVALLAQAIIFFVLDKL